MDRNIAIAELQLLLRAREAAGERRERLIGQAFAFIIALTAIVVGGVLVINGHAIVGTIFGGTPLVWVVNAFIQGERPSAVSQNSSQIDEESNTDREG